MNNIRFSDNSKAIDEFLSGSRKVSTTASVNADAGSVVFPAHLFTQIGAMVHEKDGGFTVDFGKIHRASIIDADFIKRMLRRGSAQDEENGEDLINVSAKPLWEIMRIGSNKFFIKRTAA
jgi:hypothetical protein